MKAAIALLAGAVLGYSICAFFGRERVVPVQDRIKIVRDTITKIIRPKEIKIERVKAKIVYKRDTIYRTRPFSAKLDTTVNRDSVKIEYEFPANLFAFSLKRAPDTARFVEILKIPPFERESELSRALKAIGFFAAGTVLGYAIK